MVTQPPPAPAGRVKLELRTVGPVLLYKPSPDKDVAEPSKTALVVRLPTVAGQFQYGSGPV